MKKLRFFLIFMVIALLATAGVAAAQSDQRNFRAHLSGDNEVPPVDTLAQGQAIFKLSDDGTALHYKLIAANIDNILQAHINVGPAGATGPVVAFLYPSAPPAQLIP